MFAKCTHHLNSSFIRDILAVTQQPGIISFAGGLPDPTLFPKAELAKAARGIHNQYGGDLYQYSETAGIPDFRQWIADHYDTPGSKEEIIITTGSQQGLDLTTRCLINPGDKIIVEAPSYLGALQVFTANQASLSAIPTDDEGPDLDALEHYLKQERISCFYTVPDFQNPKGTSYSLQRRKALVALAERYDFWIMEDAPYRELRYRGETLPSLQSLSPERVIRFGSFSKIIAPALRLGWISAPQPVIKIVEKMKQCADLHSSGYDQHLVLEFLRQGSLPAHLEQLKQVYGERLKIMFNTLSSQLPETVKLSKPDGGMFIWAELSETADTMKLFRKAIKQGVAFVPGEAFHIDGGSKNCLRFNFSNSDSEQIQQGIKRLTALIINESE